MPKSYSVFQASDRRESSQLTICQRPLGGQVEYLMGLY